MVCLQAILEKDRPGEAKVMNVCVVIPAFNEAENILKVISGVKALGIDVIVVDDGSLDETSLIAEKGGAYIIHHRERCGKGFSLSRGFDYAIKNGYDIIISMDADGQHDPADIQHFLDKAKNKESCVVLGNRMDNPKDMPFARIITNKLMSSVISAICRQDIPDTQCGFRLFSKDAISGIDIEARKFEVDSELLVKLARNGFKIESVPIRSIYGKEKSKIRPIRDTFRFMRFVIKILLER